MTKIESEALGSGSLGGARKCRLKIKCFKVLEEVTPRTRQRAAM